MIVEHITLKERGTLVDVYYLGRKLQTLDFEWISKAHNDQLALMGEKEARKVDVQLDKETKRQIGMDRVDKFIQIYQGMLYKYTRRKRNYSIGSKSHDAFIQAASTADQLEVDYPTYIRLLVDYYSSRNKSDRIAFPYPSQMHGDFAEQVIMDQLAKQSTYVDPKLKAKKRAIANQYIPLKADTDYIQGRERIKKGTATLEDIEYMEVRQIQVNGEPYEWLTEIKEKMLQEQNRGQDD